MRRSTFGVKTTFVTLSAALAVSACASMKDSAAARAQEINACPETKSGSGRLTCLNALKKLRKDEPNFCAFYVSGKWVPEAAVNAQSSSWDLAGMSTSPNPSDLPFYARPMVHPSQQGALDPLDPEPGAPTEHTAEEFDQLYRALVGGAFNYGNVEAASTRCLSDIVEKRNKIQAESDAREHAENASRAEAAARERQRQEQLLAQGRVDEMVARVQLIGKECEENWREDAAPCATVDGLSDTPYGLAKCEEKCRELGRAGAETAFERARTTCVDEYVTSTLAPDGCAVERPPTATMTVADFEARLKECSAECKESGSAKRREALAVKAAMAAQEAKAEAADEKRRAKEERRIKAEANKCMRVCLSSIKACDDNPFQRCHPSKNDCRYLCGAN